MKLCGKERELGDQRLMGLGLCCDVEVKKGGGKRLEPLRANSELTAIGRLLNLGD